MKTQKPTMKPIADKAEVSVDFPDKVYFGEFGRLSKYEAHAEPDSMAVKLLRLGDERREVMLHLHHFLFAGILDDIAASLEAGARIDGAHAGAVRDAAARLVKALHSAVARG